MLSVWFLQNAHLRQDSSFSFFANLWRKHDCLDFWECGKVGPPSSCYDCCDAETIAWIVRCTQWKPRIRGSLTTPPHQVHFARVCHRTESVCWSCVCITPKCNFRRRKLSSGRFEKKIIFTLQARVWKLGPGNQISDVKTSHVLSTVQKTRASQRATRVTTGQATSPNWRGTRPRLSNPPRKLSAWRRYRQRTWPEFTHIKNRSSRQLHVKYSYFLPRHVTFYQQETTQSCL